MIEVLPGIFRIKLPLPGIIGIPSHINAYIVKGDKGCLLVDTGLNSDEAFNSLREQMSESGIEIKEISQIVVTHIHPDHYGQTGRLKKMTGATFFLHEIEKDLIDFRYIRPEKLLEQTGQWLQINGVPADELKGIQDATLSLLDSVAVTYPDVALKGGETIKTGKFKFQVILTPGHSAGHICLYEPKAKVLLGGDFILPIITPNVSLHPQSGPNPLGRYISALKKVSQLDIEMVLPGHDEPFSQIKTRVEELIHHHDERSGEILKSLKNKSETAYEIASKITWSLAARWTDMPLFHRRLAISETLSHLEMMAVNGQVTKIPGDVIYYRQN
jgi:glyoxylase-like metal-dependent hydrolase (beta-lactamase superfamily II)